MPDLAAPAVNVSVMFPHTSLKPLITSNFGPPVIRLAEFRYARVSLFLGFSTSDVSNGMSVTQFNFNTPKCQKSH